MKNIIIFATLALLVGLTAGCQQATPSSSPAVPQATATASVGSLANLGCTIDNSVLTTVGITSLKGASAQAATPTYDSFTGWWSVTYNISAAISIEAQFKVQDISGNWITTSASLSALSASEVDELWVAATYTIGTTTMTLGTTASPLKFTGVGSASTSAKTLDGTITLAGVDEDGTSYDVSMTYSSITISSSGYPSGTVNFSLTSGGTEIIAGTLTCDGTSTASLTLTKGYSGTYTVDLSSGLVTAALL